MFLDVRDLFWSAIQWLYDGALLCMEDTLHGEMHEGGADLVNLPWG